jgi:hypothetical protein
MKVEETHPASAFVPKQPRPHPVMKCACALVAPDAPSSRKAPNNKKVENVSHCGIVADK